MALDIHNFILARWMSYNHRFFVKLGDYSHILLIPTKERDNQLIHGLGENKQGDWLSA